MAKGREEMKQEELRKRRRKKGRRRDGEGMSEGLRRRARRR